MRFGSVCSGIEAASVAWGPLGWKAAWFAEIEAFPSAVLAHHYPETPNHGDMTLLPQKVLDFEVDAPDVLCGGTPCQAFSVAGQRRSLEDARGNLSLVFCELANAIDTARAFWGLPPCIVFWENVPGVLSTADNAFGCFLAELAGEGVPLEPPGGKWTNAGYVLGPTRAVAWRTLDAQYFGVAQRRRRVFVVASAREGFDPGQVLLEFDGVRRDFAPCRKTREGAPGGVAAGSGSSRWWDGGDIAGTLTKQNASGAQRMPDKANFGAVLQESVSEVAGCMAHQGHGGVDSQTAASGYLVAHALRASHDASEDGTGRGTPIVPVARPTHEVVGTLNHSSGNAVPGNCSQDWTAGMLIPTATFANRGEFGGMSAVDVSDPIRASGGDLGAGSESLVAAPVAMRESGHGYWVEDTIAGTIDANMGMSGHANRPAVIAEPRAYSVREDATAGTFNATPLEVSNAVTALRPSPQSHHAQTFITQPITFGAQMSTPQTDVDLVQTLQAKNPMAVAIQDVSGRDKAQNGKGWNDDGTAYTVDTKTAQGVLAFKIRGGVEVDSAGKGAGKGYLGSEDAAFTLAATQDQWVATPATFVQDDTTPKVATDLAGALRANAGGEGACVLPGVAGTLGNRGLRSHTELDGHGAYIPVAVDCYNHTVTGDITATLSASGQGGTGTGPSILQPMGFSVCPDHCGGDKSGQDVAFVKEVDVSRTLDCTGADVTRKQGGLGVVHPMGFAENYHAVTEVDVAPGMTTAGYSVSQNAGGCGVVQPVNIYGGNKRADRPEGGFYVRTDEDTSKTLDAASGLNPTCSQGGTAVMTPAMQVRRLTPVECERLQGFPDGYTAIPYRGKAAADCPDGPRYKALGNSWAVPNVAWIGRRIDAHGKACLEEPLA